MLQIKQFQYKCFKTLYLTKVQCPKSKSSPTSYLNFFRFNYQLLWEQQDQNAYTNFPQVLTEIEFLLFIITERNKHINYCDPTSLNVTHFEAANIDKILVLQHSELTTSGNRPFITTTTRSETSLEENNPNLLQHDIYQNTQHFNQEDNDNIETFHNQQHQQI